MSVAANRAASTQSAQSSKRLYIPSSINSITIQQTESGGSPVAPIVPAPLLEVGGAGCVAVAGGQTCSATLQAALGVDAWAFASYTSANGSGTAVSVNNVTYTVLKGANNVLSLTLNPILASLAFAPTTDTDNATSAVTLPLVLNAYDTNGAIIIGPGAYVNASNVATPITENVSAAGYLQLQDAAGVTAPTTLNTSTDNVLAQLYYNGSLAPGAPTVNASAAGVTTATMTLTLTGTSGLSVPSSIALGEDLGTTTATLPISEPGYTGTFTLDDSGSCSGIVTFPTTAGPGPTASVTVTGAGGGTCTIGVSDGTNSTSVTVYNTTFGIVLQSKLKKH